MAISFGDKVKILSCDKAVELGLTGKTGEVLGETSPSSTGVSYIGEDKDDYVINVAFEELNAEYWFVPDLLELIPDDEQEKPSNKKVQQKYSKKWWQFWK